MQRWDLLCRIHVIEVTWKIGTVKVGVWTGGVRFMEKEGGGLGEGLGHRWKTTSTITQHLLQATGRGCWSKWRGGQPI